MSGRPAILGVSVRPLTEHDDARGSLTEVYRLEWASVGRDVVQANLSRSRSGVLRGLHFHRTQSDAWCVLFGKAFVGLFDLRRGSPTQGRVDEIVIDADVERLALRIPPGVAHGFYAETDVSLLYLVDRAFDGTDEFGVAWNDPDIPIVWPSDDPLLSERDRSNPPLADVLRDPPAFDPPRR